jgi:hypothetical protein
VADAGPRRCEVTGATAGSGAGCGRDGTQTGKQGHVGVWARKQDRARPDAESELLAKESERGGRYSESDRDRRKIASLLDIDFFSFLSFYRSKQI